jgi:hypothetical protein
MRPSKRSRVDSKSLHTGSGPRRARELVGTKPIAPDTGALNRRAFLRGSAMGLALAACGGGSSGSDGDGGAADAPPSDARVPIPDAVVPPGPVTTFTAHTLGAAGLLPFSLGVVFPRGRVTSELSADLTHYQVVVRRRWQDGSVKHAIVSGRVELDGGEPRTITLGTGGAAPGGAALTADAIATAAPDATVDCGPHGSVALRDLLARPFRTWIAGPEMVECHYHADLVDGLAIWFHVRLFAGGATWIRAVVENGYLDDGRGGVSAQADLTYVPRVSIGGRTVFDNGGASLAHYRNTRWTVDEWIGADPQLTASQHPDDLQASRLVPNYAWGPPSEKGLTSWWDSGPWVPFLERYVPMMQGETRPDMGGTGFGPFIGLLPLWNALYVKTGDARARRSTLLNASAVNHRPIVFRDATTKLVPRPSDFATWSWRGPGGAGDDYLTAGVLAWDQPHHPCEGYLAYLLTGDAWYLETLAMGASANYLYMSSTRGAGVDRVMRHTQVRGTAWMVRTVGAYAAIAPDGDEVAADYRVWLERGGYGYFARVGPSDPAASPIGYVFTIGAPNGPLTIPPWMQHFWIAVNGFVWDLEPGLSAAGTADHLAVRDFMYRAAVGILGPGGDEYCFARASLYDGLVISPNNYAPGGTDLGIVPTARMFSPTWAEVAAQSPGAAEACAPTLLGGSGGAPNVAFAGYWGNLLPAIAYAVDHGAPGAREAWSRLTGATNWSELESSGFEDTPVWAIGPRDD